VAPNFDMAFSLFSNNKKAILARCRDDYATKMRLKYAPYYLAMEAQRAPRSGSMAAT
jgi:8-amino-7-oxononanoate synthase